MEIDVTTREGKSIFWTAIYWKEKGLRSKRKAKRGRGELRSAELVGSKKKKKKILSDCRRQ
jgi:hypothetical protein